MTETENKKKSHRNDDGNGDRHDDVCSCEWTIRNIKWLSTRRNSFCWCLRIDLCVANSHLNFVRFIFGILATSVLLLLFLSLYLILHQFAIYSIYSKQMTNKVCTGRNKNQQNAIDAMFAMTFNFFFVLLLLFFCFRFFVVACLFLFDRKF